jgi:hypothetical protein
MGAPAIYRIKGGRHYNVLDDLFKGTNVKDTYDTTLAVIQVFSEYRSCIFIMMIRENERIVEIIGTKIPFRTSHS